MKQGMDKSEAYGMQGSAGARELDGGIDTRSIRSGDIQKIGSIPHQASLYLTRVHQRIGKDHAIAELLSAGRSIRAISRELGRSVDSQPGNPPAHSESSGNYRHRTAQLSAEGRRSPREPGRSQPKTLRCRS